ncbi:hypothetical protein ACFLXI_04790 [Chloroflexota bacterium]
MQTHNFSEIQLVDGQLSFQNRIKGIYKYGFSWPGDLNAKDVLTALLQRDVDHRSVLIRDFELPEIEVVIPFILIGPPGVRVILVTRERGMFRAKDDQWLFHTGKGFRPAKENLIVRTQLYIKATQNFLVDHGFQDIVVDGLVVGVNPGMHVETHHSVVRVIQSDAIRRFGNQWNQEQAELSPEKIYQIVSAITRTATVDPEIDEKNSGIPLVEPGEDKFAKSLEPLHKTLNFKPKQWAILGVLIAATVFVLLIFMLFIILSL